MMTLYIAIMCLMSFIAHQPSHDDTAIAHYKSRYDEFKNRRYTKNMSIVTNVKITNPNGVNQTRSTFTRLNDEFIFAEEQISRIPKTAAVFPVFFVRNNMYAFDLINGKQGEKIVKNITTPSPSLQSAVESLNSNIRESCKMKLGVLPIPSPKYFPTNMYYFMEIDLIAELPSLNINRCKDNGRFIDIEFTYSHLDPIKKVTTRADGKVTLDANSDCRCVKYYSKFMTGGYDYTVSANADINKNDNGHEVVKIIARRIANIEGKNVNSDYEEETVTRYNSVKSSDFTLSVYGLPEPGGISNKNSHDIPWFIYVTAMGAVVIVLALLISRKRTAH